MVRGSSKILLRYNITRCTKFLGLFLLMIDVPISISIHCGSLIIFWVSTFLLELRGARFFFSFFVFFKNSG